MASDIPLRTLIIEDNEDDALLLRNALKRGGFTLDALTVETKEDLAEALADPWDIVLSDYALPGFNGHEALLLVRQYDPDVPFFFVSGTMGEERAVEAMRSGAQDYFLKGSFERLASAIMRELRESASRREHREAEERIHYLANYDPLTGLPNRTWLAHRLVKLVEECEHTGQSLAVIKLNLERFRDINDHLGVDAADNLLIELAQRLARITKPEDLVARLSGDEFAIVVTDQPDMDTASIVVDRVFGALERSFSLSGYDWSVKASMGSSRLGYDGNEAEELLRNAATALHHAQRLGGNAYFPYTAEMRAALTERLSLSRAMEQALAKHEFQLHYQPQVSLDSGRIIGLEALLRWDRPGYGPVSPMAFIPVAEESGLIMQIGDWVLREACRQLQQWRKEGLVGVRVAVNFSAYQFRRTGLFEFISSVLDEFELPPGCLEIEITETVLMQNATTAEATLSALRDLGVGVAMDDFGTGYSSLSYLKRFPVDVLKIDREFIRDLPEDKDNGVIVHAIIALAEKLGLKVIAEGVETRQQLDFLRGAGCSTAQGYYLRRPCPVDELFPILQKGVIPL